MLWYLNLSPVIISIVKHQCPQGLCLSSEGASYDGYGQKVPIKLRLHLSIPLTGPRPVFSGWSLTVLPHTPWSLKAPGDHKHGMFPFPPSLPLFLGFTKKYLLSVRVKSEMSYLIVKDSRLAAEPRSIAWESD